MKDIHYHLGAGIESARMPELFYQENTVWRIFLHDGERVPADLSGVAAWGAAVAGDFCAGTPPMCRTLAENISVDVAAGSVAVALDCATPEFLAAVNGGGVKPAWFELYGLDAAGRRVIDVQFEIRARMTLDPDPLADSETPENVATKTYTSLAISGAITTLSGGLQSQINQRPTSSGAQQIADSKINAHNISDAAHAGLFARVIQTRSIMPDPLDYYDGSLICYIGETGHDAAGNYHINGHIYQAQMVPNPDDPEGPQIPAWVDLTPGLPEGVMIENRPFSTTVGGYTVAVTSGGGLVVSGGGVQLQVSSGGILVSADNGNAGAEVGAFLSMTSNGGVTISGYNIAAGGGHEYAVTVHGDGIVASGADGESVRMSGGIVRAGVADGDDHQAHVIVTSGGVSLNASDATNDVNVSVIPGEVNVTGNSGGDGVGVLVNSRPVLTDLVTSTSPLTIDVIPVLSGGTSYVYTSAMYGLEVASVVKTAEASYLHFTLDSVTAPTPVVISGVSYLNSATFEGGKEYLVGFFDGMAVVNEVTQ